MLNGPQSWLKLRQEVFCGRLDAIGDLTGLPCIDGSALNNRRLLKCKFVMITVRLKALHRAYWPRTGKWSLSVSLLHHVSPVIAPDWLYKPEHHTSAYSRIHGVVSA
jgi:hypothetical protein